MIINSYIISTSASSPVLLKINFFTGTESGWVATGSTSPFGGHDYGELADGISLEATGTWNATGSSGTSGGSQTVFPNAVKTTYWYTSGASVGNAVLSGVPAGTYNIKIIGSRAGITGPRTTRFTIGATTYDLDVDDNTDNYVEFTGVSPSSGVITISIQNVAPSDAAFGYLCALILESE